MFKIILFLGFLALTQVAGQAPVSCFQGTVVYDITGRIVYENRNVTIAPCRRGQQCAQIEWINTDEKNQSALIQTGLCLPETVQPNCSFLTGQPEVGRVSDCNATACNSDYCNTFRTQVCNNGSLVYSDNSASLVTFRQNAGIVACPMGAQCGLLTFNDFRAEINYTNYVESAFCVDPANLPDCSVLNNNSDVGVVSNCNFTFGEGDSAPRFTQQVPLNRGYRCDRGVIVYTSDKQSFVHAENFTDEPCEMNELCGMYRWKNIDDAGKPSYIESGFCINPFYTSFATCDKLSSYPDVNNVTDCSVNFCSGDFCEEFTLLNATDSCPERPVIGDIQALPGCTMYEVLDKSFNCMAEWAAALPITDESTCNDILNRSINCMSQVVQECVQFDEDGSLCPSVLDTIPGVDIAPILQEVVRYAQNVTSIESLRMILQMLTNETVDLSALDSVCTSTPEEALMGLQMLRNFTSGLDLGLGAPVCSDNEILDDLIEWGIQITEETIRAATHRDVCLAFDKFKGRMDDAVRNRCYGLSNIGTILTPLIGQFYSSIVQRAVDVTKYYLRQLEIPGCEDVPYPTQLVCNQGTVAYSLEDRYTPVKDQSNATICPPGYGCGMWRWVNRLPNGTAGYVEFGICRSVNYNYSCQDLVGETGVGTLEDCTFDGCIDDHRCLSYNKDQCREVPDDDIAILPRCTISDTLERGFGCLGSFVEGFPYSPMQRQECRDEVDSVVRCVRDSLVHCLSGDCETVLDFIPGLRENYRVVIQYAKKIDSLEDGLKMMGLDEQLIETIYGGVCGDASVRQLILEFLANLPSNIPELNVENPICDNRILNDLVQWSAEAARNILNATNHQQVCAAFTTLRYNLINAWTTRCDIEGLFQLLGEFIPQELQEKVRVFARIALEFFSNLEIPNCDGFGAVDCSRFYEATGSCALRQAWLCDYVNWKVDFLVTWLGNFQEYVSNSMILDAVNPIGCLNMEVSCMDDSQRVCRNGRDNCRFCYCRDHRYKDLSRVMEMYRQDWMRWRRAFSRYQRATEQNQDTCSIN